MEIIRYESFCWSLLVGLMLISRIDAQRRVIIPFSFPSPILVGERVVIICGTRGGDITQFQWLKNGDILRETSTLTIKSSEDSSTLKIDRLTIDDSANYSCVVNMKERTELYSASLNVLAPPEWVTVSKDKEVYVGANVSLECTPNGVPRPQVTWEFVPRSNPNILKLANAKDQEREYKLLVVNIKENESGVYRCMANNSVGTPLTKSINVNVLMLIVGLALTTRINSERRVIIPFSFQSPIIVGERVVTVCGTRGGDISQIQWLKNGELLRDKSRLSIKTSEYSSTLIIDRLMIEDTANYTCLISMKGLNERYTASLQVLAPPEWVTVSKDTVAYVGANATLECLSRGVPKPTVLWEFAPKQNGNNFNRVLNKKNGDEGLGFVGSGHQGVRMETDGSRLILTNVQETDGGEYRCTANNSVGSPLVKKIGFNVLRIVGQRRVINPFSFPSPILVGERVAIICGTRGGDITQFQWLKNGDVLRESSTLTIKSFEDTSTLKIDRLTIEDSANYSCVVNMKERTERYSATLNVLAPPEWVTVSKDKEVYVGANVSLECTPNGVPRPQVTWEFVSRSNLNMFKVANAMGQERQYKLLLINIKENESGVYRCMANNSVGTPLTKSINVNVLIGLALTPRINSERRVIIPFSFPSPIIVGERVVTNCGTRGGDINQIQWLKNGELLRDKSRLTITSSKYSSTLIIDELTIEDTANYTCLISMKEGTERYTASLQVLAPPEWVTVSKDTVAYAGANATLECLSRGVPRSTILWEFASKQNSNAFNPVHTRKNGDEVSGFVGTGHEGSHMKSDGSRLILTHVKESDDGEYRCTANNSVGSPLVKKIRFNVLSKWLLTSTTSRPTLWVGGAMGSVENNSLDSQI